MFPRQFTVNYLKDFKMKFKLITELKNLQSILETSLCRKPYT